MHEISNPIKHVKVLQNIAFMVGLVFATFQSIYAQTIEEIVDNSKKVYANAPFYLDSGRVFLQFYDVERPFEKAKYFKTVYDKKGRFNYEFYDVGESNSLFVINRDANNLTQSWWGIVNKIQNGQSLDQFLSSARGVSSRSSTIIPQLLFPINQILGPIIFSNTQNFQLAPDEMVRGALCFKISGNGPEGNTTLWIAKDNYLIKKIELESKGSKMRVKSTIDYYSYLPSVLENQLFEFRPNRKVKM